jgi:hypothetical protein
LLGLRLVNAAFLPDLALLGLPLLPTRWKEGRFRQTGSLVERGSEWVVVSRDA